VARPATTPQRPERAEVHPNSHPAGSELAKLNSLLQDVEKAKAESDKKNYQLQTAISLGTPQEVRAARKELKTFKGERAELIKLSNDLKSHINFVTNPKGDKNVQSLMHLAQIDGPQQPSGRHEIRSNINQLKQLESLMGKRDELIATQQLVRKSLENGAFNTLPKAELAHMRSLANLNVDQKLSSQSAIFKEVVDRTEKRLNAMGGGGLFKGTPSTAKQREMMMQSELQKAQDAMDNGYR